MYNFKVLEKGFALTTRLYSSSSNCKKICIVGSGPAGFYTAQHILRVRFLLVECDFVCCIIKLDAFEEL